MWYYHQYVTANSCPTKCTLHFSNSFSFFSWHQSLDLHLGFERTKNCIILASFPHQLPSLHVLLKIFYCQYLQDPLRVESSGISKRERQATGPFPSPKRLHAFFLSTMSLCLENRVEALFYMGKNLESLSFVQYP